MNEALGITTLVLPADFPRVGEPVAAGTQ